MIEGQGGGSVAGSGDESGGAVAEGCVGVDVLHYVGEMGGGINSFESLIVGSESVVDGARAFDGEERIDGELKWDCLRIWDYLVWLENFEDA